MKSIAVSELRANLMKILKEIEHGSSLDITSRGRVVAKLVPPDHIRTLARKKLAEIADLSTKLSDELNSDTADRIIAATSIISNTPLITADKSLLRSNKLTTIW